MKNCLWCGEELQLLADESNIKRLNTTIGSAFPKDHKKSSGLEHDFGFYKCSKCNLRQICSSSKLEELGCVNALIRYHEPTFHHEDLAIRIISLLGNKSTYNIYSLSPKDNDLAKALKTIIEVRFNGKFGDCTSVASADIILATRQLEHINSKRKIEELFNHSNPGCLLVVEALDFHYLSNKGVHSYLWEERLSYFSINYISKFAESRDFSVMDKHEYFDYKEPFWTLIMRKSEVAVEGKKEDFNDHLIETKPTLIENSKLRLVSACKYYLAINHNHIFVFIGIGHKALSAALYVKTIFKASMIRLYDSAEVKVGSTWNDIAIRHINAVIGDICPSDNALYTFSFSGSNAENIKQEILVKDTQAKFSYIEEWYN